MSIKGGEGGTPQIRNFLFGENFARKGGGGTPLTDKICKVVFDLFPKTVQLLKIFPLKPPTISAISMQAAEIRVRQMRTWFLWESWKAPKLITQNAPSEPECGLLLTEN